MYHQYLPEGLHFRMEPGRAEADFGRFDAKTIVRDVYILFSRSEIPIAQENQEIMDLVEPDTPLPSLFTEEDLALQVPYRCGNDYVLKFPGIEDLTKGEKDKEHVFPIWRLHLLREPILFKKNFPNK